MNKHLTPTIVGGALLLVALPNFLPGQIPSEGHTAPSYTLGGTVSGLSGTGLVLSDSGGDHLQVPANGSFVFATKLASGARYSVTVSAQPNAPAQTCVVSQGGGTVGSANISSVSVGCTTPPSVSGTYRLTAIDGSGESGSVGTLSFDASGNISGSELLNNAGTVSSTAITARYSLTADGTLTIIPVGGTALTGARSNDGATFVAAADVSPGQSRIVEVGIRQGSGPFTNALLKGRYEFVSYSNSGNSDALSTLSFDGAGHFTGSQVADNGGAVSTSALSGTYQVAANGTLTLTRSGAPPLTGGLSANGNAVVAGQVTSAHLPAMQMGLRAGSNTDSDATLTGVYEITDVGTGYSSTTTFDGAGHYFDSNLNQGTYTVAAGGGLTFTDGAGVLTGSVSANGDALIVTQITPGWSPGLRVGVQLISALADPAEMSLNPTGMTFRWGGATTKCSAYVLCLPPQSAVLRNNGTIRVYLLKIGTTLGFSWWPPAGFRESNDCPSSLAPGEYCNIKVTFGFLAGRVWAGPYRGALLVHDSSSPTPLTVALTAALE